MTIMEKILWKFNMLDIDLYVRNHCKQCDIRITEEHTDKYESEDDVWCGNCSLNNEAY